jgi:hypothetical protein
MRLPFVILALAALPALAQPSAPAPSRGAAEALRIEAADALRIEAADALRIEAAIDRGLTWLFAQDDLSVGDLFGLQRIERPAAQEHAAAEIARRAGTLGPFEGLVRPGALAREPREDWASLEGHRYEPMARWIYHAANAPGVPTPEGIVKQLLDDPHGEYLLAHQYLALRVLSERGVVSGPGVEARLGALLSALEAEQLTETAFSDLFAERLALLLWGGRAPAQTPRWIQLILDAQETDGRWRVPAHPYPTTLDEKHATVVSLWALDEQARRLAAAASTP